ncbi:hypothetical protein Scep_007124 [Stephania cephalantha]|uniref:Uncharacterized protein n=1 Tax=Stephania cephalantha TaxID=152367 RepID=A0AAP0KBU6_9MAGN
MHLYRYRLLFIDMHKVRGRVYFSRIVSLVFIYGDAWPHFLMVSNGEKNVVELEKVDVF